MAAIHLWVVDPQDVGEELRAGYLTLLSADERAQQQRFVFERDRHRYLVTRALVRTVLSRYAPVAPRDWWFSKNEFGCPRISDAFGAATDIDFNLSHTNGLIVLAVSRSRAIGVDVENIRTRGVSVDIAERFFAPDEVVALRGTEIHRQPDRFFEYWTFKESYIKARGMGLSLPLDQFSFGLSEPGEVSFRVAPELGDRASRWRFWQFRPTPEYIVALCAERTHENVMPVRAIRTVPLAWGKDLSFSFSRMSHT